MNPCNEKWCPACQMSVWTRKKLAAEANLALIAIEIYDATQVIIESGDKAHMDEMNPFLERKVAYEMEYTEAEASLEALGALSQARDSFMQYQQFKAISAAVEAAAGRKHGEDPPADPRELPPVNEGSFGHPSPKDFGDN